MQYNAHLKGINRMDQMLSYYPCERKILIWPKKIFVHFLQMIMVDAFYLYNMHNIDNKMSLYGFWFKVPEALLPYNQAKPMLTPGRNDQWNAMRERTRKLYCVCSKQGIKKQTVHVCAVRPDKPGLCKIGCFEKFHESV